MKSNKINQYIKAIVKVFLPIGLVLLCPEILATTSDKDLKAVADKGDDLIKGLIAGGICIGVGAYSIYLAGQQMSIAPLITGLCIIVGGVLLMAYASGAFTLLI